jgi:DNA-binding protein Fis
MRKQKDKDFLVKTIKKIDIFLLREEGRKPFRYIVETVEKPLIENALKRTYGNQFKAAMILGINRNTIRKKIKKLGIEVEKWKL